VSIERKLHARCSIKFLSKKQRSQVLKIKIFSISRFCKLKEEAHAEASKAEAKEGFLVAVIVLT
jgi:hypothetical protein